MPNKHDFQIPEIAQVPAPIPNLFVALERVGILQPPEEELPWRVHPRTPEGEYQRLCRLIGRRVTDALFRERGRLADADDVRQRHGRPVAVPNVGEYDYIAARDPEPPQHPIEKEYIQYPIPQNKGNSPLEYAITVRKTRLSWRPTFRQMNDVFTALIAADIAMRNLQDVVSLTKAPVTMTSTGTVYSHMKAVKAAMTHKDYAERMTPFIEGAKKPGGINIGEQLVGT